MRSFALDAGGPLHLADFGGSGPTLLLVHGLGGSHLNWMLVGDRLAQHHRVLAVDLPGFGRSPRAGRDVSVAANAELLGRVAERLGDGEPVALAGNSMGGLLSLAVAARRPEAVSALVLVDPALPPPRRFGFGLDLVTRNLLLAYGMPTRSSVHMRRLAQRRGSERLVREVLELCAYDMASIDSAAVDAHVALERERLALPQWHVTLFQTTRSLLRTLMRRRRVEEWIARVTAPTLLMHGSHDRVVSPLSARAAAGLRPDWDFQVLDRIGHVPMLEAPQRFVTVVEEWLGRVSAARGPAAAGIA